MARLIIPDDFASQRTLLSNIIQQNTDLGASSPISAFLIQQNIVLADDATAGTNAQTHETNRALLSRQSENYRQLRDNLFKLPWQHLTGCAQFLKSFYKGNTKQIGTWGITITDTGKINYPPAFTDRVAIFTAFNIQNNTYGTGTSPLQPFLTQQNIDLTTDATFVNQASANNENFLDAAQQSENETELRNQLWLPVLAHIKAIGNFLMKLYSNNPKALGVWGFTVDHSPQQPRLRTTKLKIGEQITNKSVVIGSAVTNIGEGDLHLYKGSTTTGTPQIIHKDEQFGIQKGWSSITVVNPSTLIEGKFTWMINH
ncbi:MAG TPA: hypothetical protein VHB70_11910 [Parafilimonas sp.]|nr:hypothetical protein [Parafilimonas sp.]